MLTKKIDELNEEKALLLSEIDALKCKMREGENARADSNADINKQMQRLQQKLDAMQQELYKLESEKEKYRVQYEASKAEQQTLIEKNIELKKVAQENQSLKDEIDILKHTSERVEKLESTIDNYKIKLEEMADLRRQMKSQEENNAKYVERIVCMEEEVRKQVTLKSQIEMYKKQIQELHERVTSDETRVKSLEYELKGMEEEKQKWQSDYERLKYKHDEEERNSNHSNASPSSPPTHGQCKNEYLCMRINFKKFEFSFISQDFLHNNSNEGGSDNDNDDHNSTSSSTMDGLFSSVELVNISNETK